VGAWLPRLTRKTNHAKAFNLLITPPAGTLLSGQIGLAELRYAPGLEILGYKMIWVGIGTGKVRCRHN
jgi:hypothetical protein